MKNNLLSEKLIYTGDSLTPTHLHLCTYNATEMQESSGDTFQSVKETLDNERINWLQVHGLKDTETIREICSHFEIDFLVLQDILNADHPTKIEEHDKYIVLILKIFYPNEHKEDDDLDGLLQQQVCIILGNNYVLTFLEKETDFFDEINAALRNDILKIRSRLTDYLLSVLLNSIMANYISTISSIDDALEDLEEELLMITNAYLSGETALTPGMLLSPWAFLAAFGFCLLMNILSAGIPAWRASRMNITDAINQR